MKMIPTVILVFFLSITHNLINGFSMYKLSRGVDLGQFGLQNPCPSVFQYQNDQNGYLYGLIKVHRSDYEGRIQLDVEMSLGNVVQGYNGKITLADDRAKVENDIMNGKPIYYKLHFPAWQDFAMRITKIKVNGAPICSGPRIPKNRNKNQCEQVPEVSSTISYNFRKRKENNNVHTAIESESSDVEFESPSSYNSFQNSSEYSSSDSSNSDLKHKKVQQNNRKYVKRNQVTTKQNNNSQIGLNINKNEVFRIDGKILPPINPDSIRETSIRNKIKKIKDDVGISENTLQNIGDVPECIRSYETTTLFDSIDISTIEILHNVYESQNVLKPYTSFHESQGYESSICSDSESSRSEESLEIPLANKDFSLDAPSASKLDYIAQKYADITLSPEEDISEVDINLKCSNNEDKHKEAKDSLNQEIPKFPSSPKIKILENILISSGTRKNQPSTSTGSSNENIDKTIVNFGKLINTPTKVQHVDTSRTWSKKSVCSYCYCEVTHFPRHLSRNHSEEGAVKELGDPKRRVLINTLRHQGNFVMADLNNVICPIRRPKLETAESDVNVPSNDYLPCPECLGYFKKSFLRRHRKKCYFRSKTSSKTTTHHLSEAQLTLIRSKNSKFYDSLRLKNEVLRIMRCDEISKIAISDVLICTHLFGLPLSIVYKDTRRFGCYAEDELKRHKRSQINKTISNKMRELGRLLLSLQTSTGIKMFMDVLEPDMFDNVVAATKEISGYNTENKSFKSSSLALHMGTTLKKISNTATKMLIKKSSFLPSHNREEKIKSIKRFKGLVENHWNTEVGSLALKNLKEQRWEKPTMLPLTSDVMKFQNYLLEHVKISSENLNRETDVKENYRRLLEGVFSLIMLLNRRRVGEVQYLTVKDYKRENTHESTEEFLKSLTESEKLLSKSFKRVVTGGKGTREVAILVPESMQGYMEMILELRKECVPSSNEYMFANPSTQDKPLSGYHVLLKLAKESGVSNTKLFTSTRLRKHIATVLQVLNISDTEKEQFASFMGHTKKTHETFYRLPQDVFQTAKVSKLLLAINSGKASKEKKLEEIDVGEESLSSDSEDDQQLPNKKNLYSNEENKMKPVQSNYCSESDLKDEGTINESLEIPVQMVPVLTTINLHHKLTLAETPLISSSDPTIGSGSFNNIFNTQGNPNQPTLNQDDIRRTDFNPSSSQDSKSDQFLNVKNRHNFNPSIRSPPGYDNPPVNRPPPSNFHPPGRRPPPDNRPPPGRRPPDKPAPFSHNPVLVGLSTPQPAGDFEQNSGNHFFGRTSESPKVLFTETKETPPRLRFDSNLNLDQLCGRPLTTNSLIYNGHSVPRRAYPWLVAIFRQTAELGLNYICSGSLISDRHVVTAAHCLKLEYRRVKPNEIVCVFGKLNIRKWVSTPGEAMLEPESITLHPDFVTGKANADIAVITFSDPIPFNKMIRPVCLWQGSNDLSQVVGNIGTIVGWGTDENGDISTAEPRQVSMPIVDQLECLLGSSSSVRQALVELISKNTFCAGFRNDSGPCNGDSGSAFLLRRNGVFYLRGIVSTALSEVTHKTCNLLEYVVFSDASKYLNWLFNIMGKSS